MKKHSISIIGGADGPTAVFLTGKSALLWWLLPVVMLILAVSAVILILKKER